MRSLRVIILSVVVLALAFAVTNCSTKCCCPSLEVGICKQPLENTSCGYLPDKFQMYTWEPITRFPGTPNLLVNNGILQQARPYQPRVLVTNYSSVAVRGVTVVFYWANFGIFDQGTPIGAVGVDLLPNESRWVAGPWSFVLGGNNPEYPYHICLAARVFHPCDTWLTNNHAYRNFEIFILPLTWKYHQVPFTVDFQLESRDIEFIVDAPKGIVARIAKDDDIQLENAREGYAEIKGITRLNVKQEVPEKCLLMIWNQGANYKQGETFDVTVKSVQNGKEINGFTVRFKIE